ncbi:MAG: type II toxin-antitoxin system VapC family toxin [Micrococcales bacterium]|nr:type II toxin-antitoxin system VapC family toxin [Micrococcales bacterium]
MIVLDTNVVSELMQPRPDPAVVAWVDAQDASVLCLPATCVGEILYGIARLPAGKRRDRLAEQLTDMLTSDFAGRVLPFDDCCAPLFAQIAADRDACGRPVSVADAQIAAVCRRHDAPLATRNTKDFVSTGVTLLNPWQDAA